MNEDLIIVPKLTPLPERSPADVADVRLFGLVEDAVRGQDALLGEGLPAHLALIRPLTRVLPPIIGSKYITTKTHSRNLVSSLRRCHAPGPRFNRLTKILTKIFKKNPNENPH